MIEIRNLTKSFGDLLVWEDVSFNIAKMKQSRLLVVRGAGSRCF